MFINEIDEYFLNYELMNAFDIMYLYFWMQLDVKLFFSLHFIIIMKNHCEAKRMVKPSLLSIVEPLSANFFNLQMCFLKLTMKCKC
jgi:hypothetical protein